MMTDGDRARSPVRTPDRRGPLSPAFDAGYFSAIEKVVPPVSWVFSRFYEELTSPNSGLGAFTSGEVRDIACYKDGAHEYLLMCVHIQNEGIPLVWVRTERQHLEHSIIVPPPSTPSDIIKFSYDRSKLWKPGDDDIMATAFAALNFCHVIDLLNIIHLSIFPFSWDAMWYATVVLGVLHGGFGKSWVKPPPPDWVRIALNLFAKDMPRTTESVQHQFAIQHPNARRSSLMKPEAWGNEPASPSQPPNSKQDNRVEAPVNTKEEPAHISPAPTLSGEYLRKSRPAQLLNENSDAPINGAKAKKNAGGRPRGGKPKTRPAPEIDPSNVLASKAPESLTVYDPHSPSISRIGGPLSNRTDERRPKQPASSAPTPTPTRMSPKEVPSTEAFGRSPHAGTPSQTDDPGLGLVIDKAVPSIVTAGKMTEGSPPQGQQKIPDSNFASNSTPTVDTITVSEPATKHTNSSFTNAQPSPPETPNLTGCIVRLGSTPMAIGGYSSVWRGTLLSTPSDGPDRGLQVAIKVLRASYTDEDTLKQKLHKRLLVEMRIWTQLRHENVVRLLGHSEEPEGPGLVSISYPHGNVLSFLVKNPNVNREIICADVALGLQYLHGHKPPIIHGDLKGPNVLIDGEGRASICDFGLSIILDGGPTGHTTSNFGGSLRFLPPELLEESTRTAQTDIYTYACTCIQILFDQEPYHELSKEAHLMRAMLDHRPPIEPSNEELTFPSLLQILRRCWDHDRWRRPSLNQVIDTIQRCLYRTYRANLVVRQGIRRRIRFMSLPGIEQAKLISVADDGLSIVVNSSTSFRRVPIYQRYRWEWMDRQNLDYSDGDSNVSRSRGADRQHSPLTFFFPLLGKFASSSESPPYVTQWKDYSAKFRLPYSSRVSYEPCNEATS